MEIEKFKLIVPTLFFTLSLTIFLLGVTIMLKWNPSVFNSQYVDPEDWRPPNIVEDLPDGRKGELIKYGLLLISESPKWIGPMATKSSMRYAGNNLACKNCHLDSGTRPGSASWVGVIERFPQFRNRENKIGTIEERINGCMERSMNGKKLPEDSKQMQAIIAYMRWLGDDVPKEREKEYKGFPKIEIPEVVASPLKGQKIYEKECKVCHGEKGQGLWLDDSTKGYQYPPLWGNDSYNHGAGMNRIITAAQFIKGNMPWGQATWDNPKLTDEEAYHVAAYVDSFDRPEKENAEIDFPDKKYKPISTPYGPWVDGFSAAQHKYGPFLPIIEFYKREYNITKTK